MQLGMVGLGRMGANLVRRLMRDGHDCVVYDVSADVVSALAGEGATGSGSLEEFVSKLDKPRAAWVMVPAGYTGETVEKLADLMDDGDIIIDGGNSYYRDDIDRAAALKPKGVHYVDVGTSGGVFGLDRGFCIMIGGEDDVVQHLDPVFRTIAPGVDGAARTPGKTGEPSPAENGYLHCGPHGAGHFVKMVHNGIEYGAHGRLRRGPEHPQARRCRPAHGGHRRRDHAAARAEVLPVRDRHRRRRRGVAPGVGDRELASRLDRARAQREPQLDDFTGHVSDSGEGRWTVLAAVDVGAPADVLSTALFNRFASRGEAEFANRLLSAMRKEFGGHAEKPAGEASISS